jgi:ubiquinone/menaquinone biosynthesis C-methylase UbiE
MSGKLIAEYLHEKRMKIIAQYLVEMPDVDLGAGKRSKARISLDINKEFRPEIVADIQYLPFKNASVGSIVCSHVIEHTANPSKVLMEMKRILRKRGKVVFFLPDEKSKLWRIIKPLWSYYYETLVLKGNSPENHKHSFNYENFRSFLRRFFEPVVVAKTNLGMEIYAVCERR